VHEYDTAVNTNSVRKRLLCHAGISGWELEVYWNYCPIFQTN